jgi:DNA-binding HxlR family transcriptional regulator
LKDENWRQLSPAAKIIYLYLKSKYNGSNNGQIRLHYSELQDICGLKNPRVISAAFKELESQGWITRTKIGGLHRFTNEYQLTGKYDELI